MISLTVTHLFLTIAVSGNRLYSGAYENNISVTDLTTLTKIGMLSGHTAAVRSLELWRQTLFRIR